MEMENSQSVMKESQKQLKQIMKPIQSFLVLNFTESIALFEAQKLLKSFPNEGVLGEWKTAVAEIVNQEIKELESSFNLMKTTFLRNQEQRSGTKPRESASGWRVGPLLVEMQPQNMSVRLCYNRTPLTPYIRVGNAEEIDRAYMQAESLLHKTEIELATLSKWLWLSYQKALIEAGKKQGERVYVRAVAQEFAAKTMRDSGYMKQMGLSAKIEYPLWAFQYNLDRYRRQIGKVSADMRIGLQTGSQQESNSGEALTINGLSADESYQTICHVIPGTVNG